MPGNHGYSPHLAATRYRALVIVVLAHLALGWWLLRGIAPLERPIRQSALAPVLIQEVTLAAPAPAPEATLPPQPRPQPSPAPAAMRQPDAKARARVEARPEPVPRSAAAAQREARPDAAVMTTAPTTTTTTLPMVSRVLPSAEPATLSAPVPALAAATVGQPAPSTLATPSTAPPSASAAGPAQSGTILPAQPPTQPSVPPRTEPGTGAVSAAIALVCPTQVLPVMPEFARRAGITGVVEARVVVVDGLVRDVTILSGPPIFHNAVRDAMRQYRCIANQTEVWGTQRFTFR